jgi:predicted GNAT family N-acyltransferase
MDDVFELTVPILIEDPQTGRRFAKHFDALSDAPEVRADGYFKEVKTHAVATWEELTECLGVQSVQKQPFTLVVSDKLVRDGEFDHQAKEVIDPHFHKPIVTLAIANTPQRVADIDAVLRPTARRQDITRVLSLLSQRLAYMAPPNQRTYPNPFQIRLINNEYELHEYYKLRHDVYRVMGYLSDAKARVKSKQEIDGCDLHAIHFGAFEMCDGYQRLVGTARLLLTEANESRWAAWTRNLLRADRTLRAMVNDEKLSLMLPVFQSQQLTSHLHDVFQQEVLCGELSRVIVRREFRGAGVARQLVEESIQYARENGVGRLYLECLKLHEPLYKKFGFSCLPHTGDRVIGINKSMIAMMMAISTGVPDRQTLTSH